MESTPTPSARSDAPRAEPTDAALEAATKTLYGALREIARAHLAKARDSTLEPTDLVHEAFLRLAKADGFQFLGRKEFLALASKVLRQVLIDHSRGRSRRKRGDDWRRVTLRGNLGAASSVEVDLVDLEDSLERLARLDERQARIVELRFIGGLTMDEVADLLGVSVKTVEGDWAMARAWLKRELSR